METKEKLKYEFHLIGSPYNDLPEYRVWWLLVNSPAIFKIVLDKKAEKAAWAYMNLSEIKDGLYELESNGKPIQGIRHSTNIEFIANMAVGQLSQKTGKAVGLVEAVGAITNKVSGAFMKLFLKDGQVYVNRVGGCMPVDLYSKTHKLFDTITLKSPIFPETSEYTGKEAATLIIKKWRNGTHYYAKLGGADVVIKGEQKWDTSRKAKNAGVKFAADNGFKITDTKYEY